MKYRKHKKNNNKVNNAAAVAAAAAATALGVRLVMDSKSNSKSPVSEHQEVSRIAHGDILKTALTNPSEVPFLPLLASVGPSWPPSNGRHHNQNMMTNFGLIVDDGQVLHLRRRLESTVTSSRDLSLPYEPTIKTLILCDEFEDIATLKVN